MKRVLWALALACFVSVNSASAAERVYKIKIANVTAPEHPLNVCFEKMAELMRVKSAGRLDATVFPSGQLGNLRTISEGLQMGTIEMGTQSPGGLASFMPLYGVLELPYIYSSNSEVYKVVDGPIGKELDEMFRKKTGIRVLGYWMNLYRNTTNNKHPILKAEDFKGLKLRVPETKTVMDTIAALGASPVPMNFGEVYTALSQGIIDGQENPISIIWASKLFEVQKYLSLTGHVYSPTTVMVSDAFFEELPDDLKKVMIESFEEVRPIAREMAEKQDTDLLEKLKEKGMQINEIDRSAFQALMHPLYDSFTEANGKEGAEFLQRIRGSIK